MVYLYDEYEKTFPSRHTNFLFKFMNTPKNLHEMSLEEIQAEVDTFAKLLPITIKNSRYQFKQYLEWLQGKGIDVDPTISNRINFPLREKIFSIYSAESLHGHWEMYLDSCKQYAEINGLPFSKNAFLCNYVLSVLSFAGLSMPQILQLNLADVQKSGIAGYDSLELTPKCIDVLMEYKNLTALPNRRKLVGSKYIRSTKKDFNIKALQSYLRRSNSMPSERWLKNTLAAFNCLKLGIYNKIYLYEKNNNVAIQPYSEVPEWFKQFIQPIAARYNGTITPQIITTQMKDYSEYKNERAASGLTEIEETLQELKSIGEKMFAMQSKINNSKKISKTT